MPGLIKPPQIIKASEVKDLWGINIVVYGPPGVGKTHFVSTAQDHPDSRNLLLLDIDRGTRTISDRDDIDVWPISKWEELRPALDWASKKEHEYRTIALDTLSELWDLALVYVMGSKKTKPGFAEFGKVVDMITRAVRGFQQLSKTKGWNIIFTCHEKEDKDESTGIVQRRPALSPKASQNVCAIVDMIGYLTVDSKGKRKLRLTPSPSIVAKHRQPISAKNKLPSNLENPSMVSILNILNGVAQ